MRRVLTAISNQDPALEYCMDQVDIIDKRGWVYRFNGHGIFVTCFAPCYPENHARYSFGIKESCFILLQPMFSFSIHDIGPDHPWDNSKRTIRQRIRRIFEERGRRYYVPESRFCKFQFFFFF